MVVNTGKAFAQVAQVDRDGPEPVPDPRRPDRPHWLHPGRPYLVCPVGRSPRLNRTGRPGERVPPPTPTSTGAAVNARPARARLAVRTGSPRPIGQPPRSGRHSSIEDRRLSRAADRLRSHWSPGISSARTGTTHRERSTGSARLAGAPPRSGSAGRPRSRLSLGA